MKNFKKIFFLLICLGISITLLILLKEKDLTILKSFYSIPSDLIFVFLLNLLAVHLIINSLENVSTYLFALLLFWFGWIFLICLLNNPFLRYILYFLMFYFSVILLLFYFSLFEKLFTKKTLKIVIAQFSIATFCLFLYHQVSLNFNALLFFINHLASLLFCIYYSYAHYRDRHFKKMVFFITGGVLVSTVPYLLFTFLPQYLIQPYHLPFLDSWTLYFLLVLPLVFTYILNKRNMRLEQSLPFPIDLICFSLFFIISSLIFYFILQIDFMIVVIIDYYFLTLYVISSFLFCFYSNFKQKKINTQLQNLSQEKADIFKQLIANDQLEKIGALSLDLLKSSLSFSGDALLLGKENNDLLFLTKNGSLSQLSISFLESDHLLQSPSKNFEFQNTRCLTVPLFYVNTPLGFLILARDSLSFFNSDERLFIQKYSELLGSILGASLWVAEQKDATPSVNLRPSERLIYLKIADLAIRDKKSMALYLHDDLLQKIFGLKNLVSTLEGDSKTKEVISKTLEETSASLRCYCTELYPTFLNISSLEEALNHFIEKNNDLYHQSISFYFQMDEEITMGEIQKQFFFRITKELLTNVYKHAYASQVYVKIQQLHKTTSLMVEDNGIGMKDPHLLMTDILQNHLGLASIKQEIYFLDGSFHLENRATGGLCVIITHPFIDWSTTENETIVN